MSFSFRATRHISINLFIISIMHNFFNKTFEGLKKGQNAQEL